MFLELIAAAATAQQAPAQPAQAQGARGRATVIMSEDQGDRRFQEEWGYADAIVAGDTIYVSGVVASLRPGETGYEAAYTRAFDRIGATLRRVGASWDDVVEISSFHTDLVSQMPAIVAVKNRYVKAPFPAWTAIGVSRLIPDRGLTEIKLVAKLPKKR